jgi:hypothetical protein
MRKQFLMDTTIITKTKGQKQKGLYKQSVDSDIKMAAIKFASKYVIYGLSSSESPNNIEYVGFTSLKLNRRYNNHLSIAKKGKSLKDRWIQNLVITNQKLVLTILQEEIQTIEDACVCEIKFISEYLNAGIRLYNTTKGGMGTNGMVHSEETKTKQSIANLGKPFFKIKSYSEKKKSQLRSYYYKRKALEKEKFEKQKIFIRDFDIL